MPRKESYRPYVHVTGFEGIPHQGLLRRLDARQELRVASGACRQKQYFLLEYCEIRRG